MRKRLLAALALLLGAICVLCPSGCAGPEGTGTIFQNISYNLDSSVDLGDINYSFHMAPEVQVNQPFTVTESIVSPSPLSSLTASVQSYSSGTSYPAERLDQILHPASYTGSYSMCLDVQLQLDDPSAFDVDPVTGEQEFTVVPDVTTTQTAHWTVTPHDTFGVETVPHQATVRVILDAQTTCSPGVPSLLGDRYGGFLNLAGRPQTEFTVVNDALRQERAIAAHLQPLAVAAVAAGTTASVAWAAGFFAWVRRRLGVRRKQDASEDGTQRRGAKRLRFFDDILPSIGLGGVLVSLGMGLITLGPSTAIYFLGNVATLGSIYVGMAVACAGSVVLARGVRRRRAASSD